MSKIDVSLIATAARPENWMRLYESIVTNLNIELIFVGPNSPNFQLPNNFIFIQSPVKPAQCVEIALREAKGKYIAIFADDLVFETPFGLDSLVQVLESEKNEFNISSCRYQKNGNVESDLSLRFVHGDERSPVVPIVGLMRLSAIQKIGGIDKRFIAVSYDIDLAMRFRENGGNVSIQEVYVNELDVLKGPTRLFNENWRPDRALLNSLWMQENFFREKRKYPLLAFNEINLRKYSQGPRGHWIGSKFRYIEFLGNLGWFIKRHRLLIRERRNQQLPRNS